MHQHLMTRVHHTNRTGRCTPWATKNRTHTQEVEATETERIHKRSKPIRCAVGYMYCSLLTKNSQEQVCPHHQHASLWSLMQILLRFLRSCLDCIMLSWCQTNTHSTRFYTRHVYAYANKERAPNACNANCWHLPLRRVTCENPWSFTGLGTRPCGWLPLHLAHPLQEPLCNFTTLG